MYDPAMTSVGIVGASGFGGAELLRVLARHPSLKVVAGQADSHAGAVASALYPSLASAYPDLVYGATDPDALDGLDVVFFALPHGMSQTLIPQVQGRVGMVIDLAADFRLHDASLYPQWYGEPHAAPELLADFVYGLPEVATEPLAGAKAIAAPGCYPTAAALALAPLVRSGAVEASGIIVDAASGVSGAGRDKFPFCGTDEDFAAYGLLVHRHTPEIEQATGAQVLFTPHLAPMNRGILATCYARPAGAASTADLLTLLRDFYADAPCVTVVVDPPHTKATMGTNAAHLTVRVDDRTGWVVALCAIDNLGKGMVGQAVQCANLALGLPETAGLDLAGLWP